MRIKKTAYYIENFEYGGLEKFAKDLLTCSPVINDSGITVYCNVFNRRFIEELKSAGLPSNVTVVKLNVVTFSQLRTSASCLKKGVVRSVLFRIVPMTRYFLFAWNVLWLYFKLEMADIFHVINGGYPGADSCLAACLAARIKGSKMIVLSVLSTAYPRPKFLPFFEMLIDSLVGISVTHFHANSMAAKEALISKRGFRPEKIVCIYTAIDTSLSEDKTKFGADGCINIGVLSSLMPLKGHSYLIEAAKIVSDNYGGKKVKYLIAGDGPYRKELEGLARSSGVAELFLFCGYRSGPASRILNDIDIFVFPSLQESFPYVILEAMASGLPIIASRVGGIPEQIVDRETGLLIPPSDSQAIADSIIRLLENPDLMLKYGHSARNRVKEFFDIAIFRKKINELYNGAYAK